MLIRELYKKRFSCRDYYADIVNGVFLNRIDAIMKNGPSVRIV